MLDILKRNAGIILSQGDLDSEGKLYSPLCFFLAAARHKLGTSLGAGHWRAELDDVVHLQRDWSALRAESATVGLEIGSPAVLFKQEFDEAINQAAIAGGAATSIKRTGRSRSASRSIGECALCLPTPWNAFARRTTLIGGILLG